MWGGTLSSGNCLGVCLTVAYSGGDSATTPRGLTVGFLVIFALHCFSSFVSRVPRLLVTVRVFCLLKTVSKCTQTSFWGPKNDFFSGEGPSPTTPHPLNTYGTSPLLTEILNTPLSGGNVLPSRPVP